MICDTIGLTADSYASMYVHGGSEVEEVYGGLNYADPIFYKMQTITGTASIVFDSYPGHLTDLTILGNSYQDGTPSPDNPVDVVGVGERTENLWDGSYSSYGIWLPQGRIEEMSGRFSFYIPVEPNTSYTISRVIGASTYFYYGFTDEVPKNNAICYTFGDIGANTTIKTVTNTNHKYLMFFFGLGESKNVMLNIGITALPYEPYGYKIPITCGGVTQNIYLDEPLRKQLNGDAADALNYATQTLTRRVDASCDPLVTPTTESVTLPQIQTISGANTLSVGTTVQPSSVSITGHIKPVTS